MPHRSLLWLAISLIPFTPLAQADEFTFHHVNVLGTNLALRLDADQRSQAEAGEQAALKEIDRLNAILSSYDPQSELRRWIDARVFQTPSKELADVLHASESYHAASHGGFNPGIERLTQIWKQAEQRQKLPSPSELEPITAELTHIGWEWNAERSQARSLGQPLSFNAIAKGYIIDQVCLTLTKTPGIQGGLVAIGGDMRRFGTMHSTIALRAPIADLAGHIIDQVPLTQNAMATSSGAFRGFEIAGTRYSHLLDPRSGQPVPCTKSVSVMAPTAMDADAMATLCSILPIDQSLAWIDSQPEASCLIVDEHGKLHPSTRWKQTSNLRTTLVNVHQDEPWNGGMELKINFTLHAGSGGRYRRPYVAIWIEDKDDFPVRTLVLWAQTTGPGPRWIPDLKRWYRSDRLRKLADETDLLQTVAEATRKPSAYSVTWNGLDDHKKLVPPGEYTLFIEAAREHGTYQLMKSKLSLDSEPIQIQLDDNPELEAVSIAYQHLEKTK